MTPTPTPTPSQTPEYTSVNECNVFTLFPMGVSCYVVKEPTSPSSSDGILTLKITGGTSPYFVSWRTGHKGLTLSNIPQGNYEALVVDYYGDYSANTVCSLVAPTPTPTQTPTITPSPSSQPTYPNLCFISINGTEVIGPLQFVPSPNINGKPTYTHGSYLMFWNIDTSRWEISNWDNNGKPISTNPSNIPNSAWTMLLSSETNRSVTVTEGICPDYLPLLTTIDVDNTTCGQGGNCDGSIIITTSGGVPPYQYSINGGNTFQTSNIFSSLCSNTYDIVVKDSQNIQQSLLGVVGSDVKQETYNVNVNVTSITTIGTNEKLTKWSISLSPDLPDGVSVSFDMNITNLKKINSPGTGIITINNNFYKNGSLLSEDSSTTDSITYDRPSCSPYVTEENSIYDTYNITLIKGDVITGETYASVYITDGQVGSNGCSTELIQITRIALSNGVINGCNCCELKLSTRSPETTLRVAQGDTNAFQ